MSNDCIFCKLSSGEVETDLIYEDDVCVAFNDANPKAKTHVLIVSKKHIPSLMELGPGDSEIIAHMIIATKKIAEKLNLKGYNLQINVGKDGGQIIFHLHIHLMSRY